MPIFFLQHVRITLLIRGIKRNCSFFIFVYFILFYLFIYLFIFIQSHKYTSTKQDYLQSIYLWNKIVCLILSCILTLHLNCPVTMGCRIHWLQLDTPPNKCPWYDTKQSDGEVPAMLEFWGMQSTPSLPLLPGPLWPSVVLFTNPSARAGYDTRSIFSGV